MLTVVSILTTTALFSLAMLLVLGSLLRSPVAGVRDWFFANLAMVISLPLLALRGSIPDFISIVIANIVLSTAGAFYYAGCARFLGRPIPWLRMGIGVALVGVAMVIWRYVDENLAMRVAASTAFNSIACAAISMILVRHRPVDRSPYNFWFAAVLSLVFAATQLTRGLYFLMMPPDQSAAMQNNIWNIGLLTVGAVIMPTMTMVAVMMVHDEMLSKVEHALHHDHLTGALSRKRFETVVRNALATAHPTRPLSLLLIDLDHFKRINDSCGHAGGDEVLRAFVTMAHGFMRAGDALGRLGGEEFGLLLPATSLVDAAHRAEALRLQAEQQVVNGDFGSCRYSISIGIAAAIREETPDRFSARADRALYIAKNNGRNRISSGENASPANDAKDANNVIQA
ncbi:GGDEF domain-containing protein [Herbaspirillum sp. meg3]|jgi:diguanylate cyclase (GGDEF)-like protein|uniref:GGDEF domain-containing protein n=1 Tax=Herbaspirillum sp. meg3 TaxID=2025949 RepID=UPI000B98CB71|nr:GGDEF domain-containing protein [Herbaspirillum sp. meg3]ASU37073.1 GGDEF domain-containing protein [Herbaspirillum sp. meg3]